MTCLWDGRNRQGRDRETLPRNRNPLHQPYLSSTHREPDTPCILPHSGASVREAWTHCTQQRGLLGLPPAAMRFSELLGAVLGSETSGFSARSRELGGARELPLGMSQLKVHPWLRLSTPGHFPLESLCLCRSQKSSDRVALGSNPTISSLCTLKQTFPIWPISSPVIYFISTVHL